MVTVKDICKDVLNAINSRNLFPESGSLISSDTTWDMNALEPEDSAQDFIKHNTCAACAKGCILLTWISKFNNFTIEQLLTINHESFANYPEELLKIFGFKLLTEIEVAFELQTYPWNHEFISASRASELFDKYSDFYTEERLVQIMEDIINDTF